MRHTRDARTGAPHAKRLPRRQVRLLGGLTVAAAMAMLLGARSAAQTSDHEEIRALSTCYARATDAIGYAIHKPPVADHNTPDGGEDENFTAGLARYRQCFADDFRFNIVLPGGTVTPWETLIPTHAEGDDPALQWANYVNNAFRGDWDCPAAGPCNKNQYESTQHQLGSIAVTVDGDTAFLESYLIAIHAYHPQDAGGRTGMSVNYGTYQNEVVRERGRWVIRKRDLILRRGSTLPE